MGKTLSSSRAVLTAEPLRRLAKMRVARFEDYGGIAELQSRNGLTARSYDEWSGLWTDNPAYGRGDDQLPIGWILEGSAGEVGGYLGNLPLMYELGGREVLAATPYSWVVDPAFRSHSLELLRRFLRQDRVDLFISTTPNAAAEKVYRAFGFSKVASGRWDRAGFWITGYRGFAFSALRAASMPWAGLLAYPLSALLFLKDALSQSRLPAGGVDFELCAGFDSRFDTFWEELKSENPGSLLAVRTRESLDWHFRTGLAKHTVRVLAVTRDGRLLAFAVFIRQDHPELQLQRYRFADFQALRGFEGLLRPVLDWMLDSCRREHIHVVENPGCWLERFGVAGTRPPYHRRLQPWSFYYWTGNQDLFGRLQDPNVWSPSSFEGDTTL